MKHVTYIVPLSLGFANKKALTSLRIRAVWPEPLLFANWKVFYLNLLQANFNFLGFGLYSKQFPQLQS